MPRRSSFQYHREPPTKKAPDAPATTRRPPTPNEHVNALPTTYSAMALPDASATDGQPATSANPTTPPSAAAAAAQPREPTAWQQYALQARIERLRNLDRARTASVSFGNSGANDAATPPASSDSLQTLQERILNLAEHSGQLPPAIGPASLADRDDHTA